MSLSSHAVPIVVAVCATLFAVQPALAESPSRTLFDFTSNESSRQWVNVNDGVMGGISQGRYRIRDNTMEFYGNLSLANNGGFASVRSRSVRPNLRGAEALLIRVRGDGRKYYLNLRVPNNRMAFSYRVSFPTQAGKWQEVRVPLDTFQATSFGRIVRGSGSVPAQSVNSVGFMISDKKAGPFRLQVDWIKAVPVQGGRDILASNQTK